MGVDLDSKLSFFRLTIQFRTQQEQQIELKNLIDHHGDIEDKL